MSRPNVSARLLALAILIGTFANVFAPVGFTTAVAQSDADSAMQAAYELSVLESQGDTAELYRRMHPDAQTEIQPEVVEYWYSTYFTPRGPNPAMITGVSFLNWTWEVTGRTFLNTAEVSFTQSFADGSVTTDVVRLVMGLTGEWHWFFGRSPEFVQNMETEARNSGWLLPGSVSLPESRGISPAHLFGEAIQTINLIDPACFDRNAVANQTADYLHSHLSRQPDPRIEGEQTSVSYVNLASIDPGMPEVMIYGLDLGPNAVQARIDEIVELIGEYAAENPGLPAYSLPPRAMTIDLLPSSPYLFVYVELWSEPYGSIPVLIFGSRTGTVSLEIGALSPYSAINEAALAWAANIANSKSNCLAVDI